VKNKLPVAAIKNAAGEFVRASTAPLPSEVVTLEMQALGRIRT